MTKKFGTKKVGLVSLGCPKNLVDSEVMLGRLSEAGYQLTRNPEEAELLIVNTCGFIEAAKQESIDTILEMARYKEEGNCRRLVVSGCLAQRYAEQIGREMPEVDLVVGLDRVDTIVAACEARERKIENLRADGSAAFLYDHLSPRVLTTPGYSAYIKVAEGCDYPCSFCIIPKIRGQFRSRSEDSILAEAEALASRGVRELVLIAQDTTHYGADLGLKDGLARLLRQLAQVDGVAWVRFLYAYPTTIGDAVLQAMADEPAICNYIDLPLQHASHRTLKAMKRPGTGDSNRRLLERIRAAVPSVSLRSSFIVGFPGETEEDFQSLLDFCAEVELDHLGVFTYSNEEDTTAHVAAESIDEETKSSRRERLMRQQSGISLRRNRSRIGTRIEVLVEGPSEETELLLRGRTEGQAPEIDSGVLINDAGDPAPAAGSFVTVEVTEAHPYDLVGAVVDREADLHSDVAPGTVRTEGA